MAVVIKGADSILLYGEDFVNDKIVCYQLLLVNYSLTIGKA